MAIVRMKKFTLFAYDSYKPQLLKELQHFGEIHFKNLQNEDDAELDFLQKDSFANELQGLEAERERILFSLKKLERYYEKPAGLKALTAPSPSISFEDFDSFSQQFDYSSVYSQIKAADEELESCKSEIVRLKGENDELRIWGALDIALEDIEKLKSVRYIIGSVNRHSSDGLVKELSALHAEVYIEKLGQIKENDTLLFVIPAKNYDAVSDDLKNLGLSKLSLSFKGIPKERVRINTERIEELGKEAQAAAAKIKELAENYKSFKILDDVFKTQIARISARGNFLKSQTVLVAEGWVSAAEEDKARAIVESICGGDCSLEFEEVAKDSDDVPIKLKNSAMVSPYEMVTEMFAMPKYNEIDPTPLLMPFYWLFFGLMVGDIGYGILLVAAPLIALKFFNLNAGTKRFLQFFFSLGFGTIVGGLVYGGCFGITVFTPIRMADGTYKAILDSQLDITSMLLFGVALGVIQLFFALIVKGYMLIRDGLWLDAIFDSLLWLVTLSGGILWLIVVAAPGTLPDQLAPVFKWCLLGGLIGLLCTQGRSSPTIAGKIANGLYGTYGISGYVGDFISYSRIAALALSGSYISFSFLQMVNLIPGEGSMIIVKIIFGGIIYILGQALNFGLAALGAYVHTSRLQYVEFFGKFFSGGGVPFRPLKIKSDNINIK